MTARKILFPTDFSESSEAALKHAVAVARERNATLLIVHVLETPGVVPVGAYTALAHAEDREREDKLREILPAESGVQIEHQMVRGAAADGILQVAQRENVELIVMATHGRSGLTHLLMGSVAEHVVRRATCPVLTLRRPETEMVPT